MTKKIESGSLRKTTRIPSLGAINGDVEEKNDENGDSSSETATSETREKRFTDKDLEAVWKEFGSIRRKQGKAQEQHIFVQPYKLDENTSLITIELNNSLQQDILNEIRGDFVQYLRNKLENDHIQLQVKLQKDNGKKLLYTNKEKYDHLAEKNPAVQHLQKKLGLDPDF